MPFSQTDEKAPSEDIVSFVEAEKNSLRSESSRPLPLGAPIEEPNTFLERFKRKKVVDIDSVATQPSVFDDPNTLEIYRPPSAYENAHRFDPAARWTWREEKRVVRKIDARITVWAFMMFMALDLDRTNIYQANTDNFLQDLRMNTNDYNLGNTLFRLSFLIAEIPSQLVSKRVGPDVWVPTQLILWSIVSLSQFWLSGRTSFLATRFLLGVLQGGFIPDTVLYLSYFYTKRELPIRLAWCWVSNYVTEIFSAFLATGILRLRTVTGRSGWRYLFLIEGIFTLSIGLASFWLMPPGPTQTRKWFSEREEVIIVNRVLRDDPGKSSMHNREGLSLKQIAKSMMDWRMWPLYVLGLLHMVPVGPPQTYLTLSLRSLGFGTTQTNLLSIPSKLIGMVTLFIFAWLSEIINSRTVMTVMLQIWALPLLCALYTFNSNTSQWVYFAVVTLITGFPYIHPIQVAWASRNSNGVGIRTMSASIYNMFVQAGAISYANIYRNNDKPLYKRGNRVLIGICSMNIVLYGLTFLFYRTINKRRDKIWDSLSAEQRKKYLETTKDEGNARLDFRFAY